MKKELQRIKIAEACGWKIERATDAHGREIAQITEPDGNAYQWKFSDSGVFGNLPDYLNDLNAMHEAEKVLITATQQNRYQAFVSEIAWSDPSRQNNQVVFNQLTATACPREQRLFSGRSGCGMLNNSGL